MKRYHLLSLFAVLLFACTDQPLFNLQDGLYIHDVTIITPDSAGIAPYVGHLVTDEGKIVYVGKEAPKVSGSFTTIDGHDRYLIPGLIDSHVHITEVQGMVQPHMEQYPELVEAFRKQLPRSYLYFGFTTLINLGGISEELLDFFWEQPLHPDILHTGRSGAAVANGYPMNYAPQDIRFDLTPNFLYLESEADNIPDRFDPADHTPEAVVKRIKSSGAVAVKAYYESGFGRQSNLPLPTQAMLEELQQEASANKLPLIVHGNSLEAHRVLSNVGVDILAHGLWNWGEYRDTLQDSLPAAIREILDMQIQKRIGYMPTLTVIAGEAALMDSTFLDDPQLKKVLPKELIAWYRTEEGRWFAKEIFGDAPAERISGIYANIQSHGQTALKYLSDHGGRILFSTDTPSGPIYANPPGYNGFLELQLMYEAGMPLDKILASATINNARAFRLDDVGTLAAGKRANMLLLQQNPLETIMAYDRIETVILEGKATERQQLTAEMQQ